ncbi:hypothetical protein BdWA1_001982 [Babesia duncani]|uniref:Uncharacterized protein n=1 Tax=Babesia duncani TaxID=323732 RepID=A0AAD9UP47_9APIC|nr:hypothetical protein BdWA1_001982 [Babesia duncani]
MDACTNSKAGHVHGPLMFYGSQHLTKFAEHYNIVELSMVSRAHCLLEIKNDDLMHCIAREIVKRFPNVIPTAADSPRVRRISQDSKDLEHVPQESEKCLILEAGTINLLWIMQGFASFYIFDGNIRNAIMAICNEMCMRIVDLTPMLVSNFLHALATLRYRHETFLEILVRELEDPRLGVKFNQDELKLCYEALNTFGVHGPIYKVSKMALKQAHEINGGDSTTTLRQVMAGELKTFQDDSEELTQELKIPPPPKKKVYIHVPEVIRKHLQVPNAQVTHQYDFVTFQV